jgi:hypothetical protein
MLFTETGLKYSKICYIIRNQFRSLFQEFFTNEYRGIFLEHQLQETLYTTSDSQL